MLHGGADPVTEVGAGATIGHLCVVHGAVIGAEALIGNGATVLDGAMVGAPRAGRGRGHRHAGHGHPRRHAGRRRAGPAGGRSDARRQGWVDTNPATYRALARRHAAGVRRSPAITGRPPGPPRR